MPDSSFRGHIPADRWYCRAHDMWVTRPDDASGEVLIGATGFGLFLAGELIAFTAKPRGMSIANLPFNFHQINKSKRNS